MNKRPLSVILLGALAFLQGSIFVVAPAVAQQTLYVLDGTAGAPAALTRVVGDAYEQFVIHLEPKQVANNPSSFSISLPSGQLLDARREHFAIYGPAWKSWSGSLHLLGESTVRGHVVLVYHGDYVSGIINFEDQRFQLVQALDGGHRLVRLSDRTTPVCALHDSHASEASTSIKPTPTPNRIFDFTPGADPESAPGATRIDVLALYTRDFFPFPISELGVIDFVQDSIAIANSVFANSNVDAYYNLIYVGALLDDQPPATGLIDGWQWINGDPSEAVALRDDFGADIVALIVPFGYDDDSFCGIANLPQADGNSRPAFGFSPGVFGDHAYSVQRDGCGLNDYTLTHEIGHNYGMRHDTEGTVGNHLFPNGRGQVFEPSGPSSEKPTPMATVMGCFFVGGPISGAVCNRIPHFSDPSITYKGSPTGGPTRNNAEVARQQLGAFAAFRAVSSNTPPNALFTLSCNGNNCSFDATGSADGDGSIVEYLWSFGDGAEQSNSSATTNHTYTSAGFFFVHLTVVDNEGQRDSFLATANPNGPTLTFVASYIPAPGASRVEFASTSDDPPSFDFYYDEPAGNFEERPGAPCNTGQNNSTYLTVRVEGDQITACSFQGWWDLQSHACSQAIIDLVNAGEEFILGTDEYTTDISTCAPTIPLESHLPFNQPAWFHVTLTSGGITVDRRVNFVKVP